MNTGKDGKQNKKMCDPLSVPISRLANEVSFMIGAIESGREVSDAPKRYDQGILYNMVQSNAITIGNDNNITIDFLS